MSIWYEVEDKRDIALSDDSEEIQIFYKQTEIGSHYVAVPTDIIVNFLREKQIITKQSGCVMKCIIGGYQELLDVHEDLITSSPGKSIWSAQKRESVLEEIKRARKIILRAKKELN